MRQETRQTLEKLKTQIIEATEHLDADEREEFFNEINEWTYGEYESALLCQEAEMQNYEED